jgi:hypothetical protein
MNYPGPSNTSSKHYKSCFASIIVIMLLVSLLDTETYMKFVSSSLPNSSSSCVQQSINENEIKATNETSQSHAKDNDKDIPTTFQSFNTTNPHSHSHSHSWCPNATCHNSPLCQPCQRRYLFILATARSGSTTLLKMLNYLPAVRISGENRNELYTASLLQSNLRKDTHVLEQDFDRTEVAYLHNAIPPQGMSCAIQGVMNAINPPPKKVQNEVNVTGRPSLEEYDRDTILGAKTIRFQKGGWSVKEAADFLRENFPCSRVVVNIRTDVEGQLKSIDKTFQTENGNKKGPSTDKIGDMNRFLMHLSEELGEDMARLVDMNDWTKDVEILNDLIHWLGFRECKYKEVVHENVNGYGRDHDTDTGIGEKCHYPY